MGQFITHILRLVEHMPGDKAKPNGPMTQLLDNCQPIVVGQKVVYLDTV